MAKQKLTVLSSTLAEIYVRQGHLDKARQVFERLLDHDRSNEVYKRWVALLSENSPTKNKLRRLSQLLKRIEEVRDERETIK
jgi:pentatricopeptide repeat protein